MHEITEKALHKLSRQDPALKVDAESLSKYIRISTPFIHGDGDHIQVFIAKDSDKLVFTDLGETIGNISMALSGIRGRTLDVIYLDEISKEGETGNFTINSIPNIEQYIGMFDVKINGGMFEYECKNEHSIVFDLFRFAQFLSCVSYACAAERIGKVEAAAINVGKLCICGVRGCGGS